FKMALPNSYDRGRYDEFDHSRLLDKVRFNCHGTIVTTSSSLLSLHSKYFREFFIVNNTHNAGKYNLRYDPDTFKDLLNMMYPCKHPPIGDTEWNSKAERRLELALKLNIPKIVKMLLTNFRPTEDLQSNALKAIDLVAPHSRFTHLLTPYLNAFNDSNELFEHVRRRKIEMSDKTKAVIFDHFTEGEPLSKRRRSGNDEFPTETVFFDVDPAWPDTRVIVIDGVSILVSTSTLALHSMVFREWFIDDRTRIGPKRDAHFYNGIGLREMTRFLSIIATDSVDEVDESLLDAVFHLQAKRAQVICEEWLWRNKIDNGDYHFLKMIINIRGKYGKLDDAYVLSLAPLLFNRMELREEGPLDPSAWGTTASSSHGTPLRSMQNIPSHMLTPARTPRTPIKTTTTTPAATRPTPTNETAGRNERDSVMFFFSGLDDDNRSRVDRLLARWEAGRLRVIVRDESGRDHVIYLNRNESHLHDLRVE
ncbi:hypothetical protein PMAYCL1PPCAC_07368, partial [Pristionchus mayeri]